MSKTGVAKFCKSDRYGFIIPDEGGDDVFVHCTHCDQPLEKGDVASYDVGFDTEKHRQCAVNVTLRYPSVDPGSICSAKRKTGIVKFCKSDRYGFIIPDEGGDDVFAHCTQCDQPMEEGDVVSYNDGFDTKKHRRCAINVTVQCPSGSDHGGTGGTGHGVNEKEEEFTTEEILTMLRIHDFLTEVCTNAYVNADDGIPADKMRRILDNRGLSLCQLLIPCQIFFKSVKWEKGKYKVNVLVSNFKIITSKREPNAVLRVR